VAGNPKTLLATGAIITLLSSAACAGGESRNQTPSDASTTVSTTEADVKAFIGRFMRARQDGLPADEFLSPEARAAYEKHAKGGLWLYDDTLPGGPGGEYQRFSVEPSTAGKILVRIRVVWLGDAPPTEILEVLRVGPGRNLAGEEAPLVVLEATRSDDGEDDGLPLAVAKKRQQIYAAAIEQNYEALEALLDPSTFSYSFGENGDPIGYWRRQEDAEVPILGDILPGVVHTRFGRSEDIYMWPSVAAKEPSAWTDADRKSMQTLGYTEDEIASFEQYGGYTGWRAGIRADGTWLFFVSGD
jgi:hypothetical protein